MCAGDDPTCHAFEEHRRRFRRDLEPERRAFLKSGFAATGAAAGRPGASRTSKGRRADAGTVSGAGAASSEALFSAADVVPTLLGLAGLPVPKAMQGKDLSKPIVTGKGKAPDSAYFQIFGPFQGDGTDGGWRGVRTARYMYADTIHPTPYEYWLVARYVLKDMAIKGWL